MDLRPKWRHACVQHHSALLWAPKGRHGQAAESRGIDCQYVILPVSVLKGGWVLLQVLKVYQDGKQIASNVDNGPPVWNLTVPVQAGSRYLLVQEADNGMPYGGYRGQPGLRYFIMIPLPLCPEKCVS